MYTADELRGLFTAEVRAELALYRDVHVLASDRGREKLDAAWTVRALCAELQRRGEEVR
jgi:hypothetical protein